MISGTPAPGLVLLYTSHIRNLSAVSNQLSGEYDQSKTYRCRWSQKADSWML